MLITGIAMLWMIMRAITGISSIGDIVFFYQAFNQGQNIMAILLHNAGDIYKNVLFLESLFDLLEMSPIIKDPEYPSTVPDLKKGINMKNITFKYPDDDRYVLENFNMFLESGKVTAIVGENGDGKTTLIKLLCRFYDPEIGTITVDDCDIKKLKQSEWRKYIAVLFQEPIRYYATVSENITYGEVSGKYEYNEITYVSKAAGAHEIIERLPDKYNTVLGKWFGGAELSGGEWQRLALARAYLRKAKLIILDEPTSMLDAWSEAKWYSRFLKVTEGCTVLIISHRLTTSMQADVIHIMQNGQIIESGSHDELMKINGRYSEAWKNQRTEVI